MTRTLLASIVLGLSCAACVPPTLLANRARPHPVAKRVTVQAWCNPPEAKGSERELCTVEIVPGDWVFAQELLTEETPSK